MSHPCGNYNENILSYLGSLGIKIGFRSSMNVRSIKSSLEIPREDHANILMLMKGRTAIKDGTRTRVTKADTRIGSHPVHK